MNTFLNFLFNDESTKSKSKWQLLEDLLNALPKTKEERAIAYFDEFVQKTGELFPEVEESLNFLRPLIIRQIINKNKGLDGETNPLSDSYFEELRKL